MGYFFRAMFNACSMKVQWKSNAGPMEVQSLSNQWPMHLQSRLHHHWSTVGQLLVYSRKEPGSTHGRVRHDYCRNFRHTKNAIYGNFTHNAGTVEPRNTRNTRKGGLTTDHTDWHGFQGRRGQFGCGLCVEVVTANKLCGVAENDSAF